MTGAWQGPAAGGDGRGERGRTRPAFTLIELPAVRERKAKGFTLIELLAVVAVMSVVVSLSMPTLAGLVGRAREVTCQGNLAGMTRALALYAADWDGYLPTGPVERSFWAGDPDRGTPYELYDAGRIGRADLSSQAGWYGQGLLWKGAYVEAGAAYYCVAASRRGGLSAAQAWPKRMDASRNPADGKTRVYGTYAYRGGMRSQGDSPLGPVNVFRSRPDVPVLCDNPCSGSLWHEQGYNVAFTGGQVKFFAFDAPVIVDGKLPTFWAAVLAQGP